MQKRLQILQALREHVLPARLNRLQQVLQNRTRLIRVVVEDLNYERNAGAVFRSCDCFGIQDATVIEAEYKKRTAELISKGSDKWLSINQFDEPETDNSLACMQYLKASGYQIVACTPHNADTVLPNFKIIQKTAILFGNEEDGLTQTALEHADVKLKIPIYGFSESYNISVSAALVLQQVVTALHQSDMDWRISKEEKIELEIEWILKSLGRAGEPILKKISSDLGIDTNIGGMDIN